MRRVPGLRHVVVAQALPVGVADHRRALTALRPAAARAIVAGREGGAVRLGAGEYVVHVRRVAAAVDLLALLRQRRVLGEVVLAVELGHVLRDDGALGVLPGAAPDAVARVDGAGPLRAQVRVPRFAARARRLRERLTGLVRAGEAAEVGALARAGAGHEEAHVRRLRLRDGSRAEAQHRDRYEERHTQSAGHAQASLWSRWCVVERERSNARSMIRPDFETWRTCLTCRDRKSTRLNSSHANISYAVFCLKKKKK